jgi:hypothetical protein
MADAVFQLFDEYAARYARGERPDARDYLARAGERQEELRDLLDRFLASSSPPEPDEETLAAMNAWLGGDPPLLELRVRRGLGRDQVVDALTDRLGLDHAKREKVKRYYHRLETGLLDPSGVDRRVFDVLAEALHTHARDFLAWRPPPVSDQAVAYLRAEAIDANRLTEARARVAAAAPGTRDEIDELFTGGSA